MGNKYYKPTSDVIDLVESTLRRYHEHLEDSRIIGKLGVANRTQAALWMLNQASPEQSQLEATQP